MVVRRSLRNSGNQHPRTSFLFCRNVACAVGIPTMLWCSLDELAMLNSKHLVSPSLGVVAGWSTYLDLGQAGDREGLDESRCSPFTTPWYPKVPLDVLDRHIISIFNCRIDLRSRSPINSPDLERLRKSRNYLSHCRGRICRELHTCGGCIAEVATWNTREVDNLDLEHRSDHPLVTVGHDS